MQIDRLLSASKTSPAETCSNNSGRYTSLYKGSYTLGRPKRCIYIYTYIGIFNDFGMCLSVYFSVFFICYFMFFHSFCYLAQVLGTMLVHEFDFSVKIYWSELTYFNFFPIRKMNFRVIIMMVIKLKIKIYYYYTNLYFVVALN